MFYFMSKGSKLQCMEFNTFNGMHVEGVERVIPVKMLILSLILLN